MEALVHDPRVNAVLGWAATAIVARFASDRWLGTGSLRSQMGLRWDIVSVTVVGVALGVFAEWSFDRFEPVGSFGGPG